MRVAIIGDGISSLTLAKALINENIYVVPKSKIHHLGGQAVDPRYEKEIELARNWHWMWSKFYYNNKHYGYFNAVTKILNNLISAFIKFSFFSITYLL